MNPETEMGVIGWLFSFACIINDEAGILDKKIENSPFDPFVKWFFPKLLRFVPQWMSANVISVIGIMVGFLAGFFMVISGYFEDIATGRFFYLLGGFFVLFTWVTDTMDGVVARARNQQSGTGYYLDHFGDALTTVFVGLGIFATNNSHIAIGFMCVVVYMLFHVHVHIRKSLLKVMELPYFGPTEARFLIVTAIVLQAGIQFRQPLDLIPSITGVNGSFTRLLGFTGGMTFIDILGSLAVIGGLLGLFIDMGLTMRRISKNDSQQKKN